MTQRIRPNFLTQRNDFFVWLKELIFLYDSKNWFFCLTQRIETFFFEYDAENWTLFLFCRKELKLSSLPQIIEFFSKNFIDLKNCTFFFWYDSKKWNLKKMTQRVEFFFDKNLTHRNDWSCQEKWLKELNLFFNNDSKDWTLCKRLIELSLFYEPLLNLSWFFFIDSKNWTFFECNSLSWIFWAWLKE